MPRFSNNNNSLQSNRSLMLNRHLRFLVLLTLPNPPSLLRNSTFHYTPLKLIQSLNFITFSVQILKIVLRLLQFLKFSCMLELLPVFLILSLQPQDAPYYLQWEFACSTLPVSSLSEFQGGKQVV